MLTHRGFDAWITSDGIELPEYEVAVDEENHRVTCWIASEEGKSFAVSWRDSGTKVDSAAYISLDGFKVPGYFLYGEGATYRSGVRTGETTERPFTFAKVEEASASVVDPDVDPKQLGMIVVKIKQIRRIGGYHPNDFPRIPNPMKGRHRIYEMRVGYGAETSTPPRYESTWKIEPYDKQHRGAFVTFVFRYRSKDFLEAQGLKVSNTNKASKQARKSGASFDVFDSRANSVPLPVTPGPSPKRVASKRLRRTVSASTSRKSQKTSENSSASSQGAQPDYLLDDEYVPQSSPPNPPQDTAPETASVTGVEHSSFEIADSEHADGEHTDFASPDFIDFDDVF